MILPGLAAGVLLSGALSGPIRALLWQMSPYGPVIFAGIPIVLCGWRWRQCC
jgi:hypothetical protein